MLADLGTYNMCIDLALVLVFVLVLAPAQLRKYRRAADGILASPRKPSGATHIRLLGGGRAGPGWVREGGRRYGYRMPASFYGCRVGILFLSCHLQVSTVYTIVL
jgi:hypothetical protein